jgi:hypothetical protein
VLAKPQRYPNNREQRVAADVLGTVAVNGVAADLAFLLDSGCVAPLCALLALAKVSRIL